MQGKKKANSVCTTMVEGTVLTIDVLNAGKIVFDAQKASAVNRARAEMHGWAQRLCDVMARSKDQKTGKPVSPQVKYDLCLDLAEWYMEGGEDWKRQGQGKGESTQDNLLLMAFIEAYPEKDEAKLKAFLKGKSAVEKLKMSQSAKLKPIFERLTEELVGENDMDAELEAFEAGLEDEVDDKAEVQKFTELEDAIIKEAEEPGF